MICELFVIYLQKQPCKLIAYEKIFISTNDSDGRGKCLGGWKVLGFFNKTS